MEGRRLAYFLPNIFTGLNMACGFSGLVLATNGHFFRACVVLGLGAVFDMVDGRIARLTGTSSSFGEQFDSMSDIITFGVAPAWMFYNKYFIHFGRVGTVLAFLFLLCGALRLARFNANIDRVDSNFFQGLPIPGAAMGLVGFVLFDLEFEIPYTKYVAAIYIFVYAIMMISNLPFPSFKNSSWVRRHRRGVLMLIFIILAMLFVYGESFFGVTITLYVLGSLIYYLFNRGSFVDIFKWEENDEDPKK